MRAGDPHNDLLRLMTLMLKAGEVMLRSGMAVSDCTSMLVRLARAFGYDRCEVIVELNTITLSYLPASSAEGLDDAVTLVHTVDVDVSHVYRVEALARLVGRVEDGELELTEAGEELERLAHSSSPYPRWLVEVAAVLSVAGWVVFAGGAVVAVLVAMVGAVLARPLLLAARSITLPEAFVTALGATVAVGVPYAAAGAGLDFALNPAIIAGLYPLLPGGALVASVSDGIAGNLMSSIARGLQAFIVAVGVAGGVLVALAVVTEFAVEVPDTRPARWHPGVTALAAALAVGALGVAREVPARAIAPIAGLGAVAYLITAEAVPTDLGRSVAAGLGGFVLGAGAHVVAQLQRSVGTVYTTNAVLVLVPGTTLYLAMVGFARGVNEAGLEFTITALSISLGIAAGITIGESLARGRSGPGRGWTGRPRRIKRRRRPSSG
ncbi:MAG: threonine/serine exporter family protein [Acidimicrobiia bacterium]|nr:threonine/serine exporter family protein [Acidimicrobiia bacterium]